jgi:hypothetical protein
MGNFNWFYLVYDFDELEWFKEIIQIMTKKFILTRTLKPGMQGEDVRKLQNWLNIVNSDCGFSKAFPKGVPENGKFQTFILSIFYHEFLRHLGIPVSHVYDKEIHELLCKHVNSVLFFKYWDKAIHTVEGLEFGKATEWETTPGTAPVDKSFGF